MREGTLIATSLPVTVTAVAGSLASRRANRIGMRVTTRAINRCVPAARRSPYAAAQWPRRESSQSGDGATSAIGPRSSRFRSSAAAFVIHRTAIGRHVGETIRESNDPPVEEVFICDIDSDQVARLEA